MSDRTGQQYRCEECGQLMGPECTPRFAAMNNFKRASVFLVLWLDDDHQIVVDVGIDNAKKLVRQATKAIAAVQVWEAMT